MFKDLFTIKDYYTGMPDIGYVNRPSPMGYLQPMPKDNRLEAMGYDYTGN
jgi:hypothetical protein